MLLSVESVDVVPLGLVALEPKLGLSETWADLDDGVLINLSLSDKSGDVLV